MSHRFFIDIGGGFGGIDEMEAAWIGVVDGDVGLADSFVEGDRLRFNAVVGVGVLGAR